MSITITYPDYIDALITYLREQPALTSAVSANRILASIQGGGMMADHNALVFTKAGRAQPVYPTGTVAPRIDALAFGTNAYESMRMMRILLSILTPVHGDTRFTSKGVTFDSVWRETEPLQMENEENWPYVHVSLGAIILRAPAPVGGGGV